MKNRNAKYYCLSGAEGKQVSNGTTPKIDNGIAFFIESASWHGKTLMNCGAELRNEKEFH